jgi:hypothetical protein
LIYNPSPALQSKLCLVDLAGSERRNRIGPDPRRQAESIAINQANLALGRIAEALATGSFKEHMYRASKLTMILAVSEQKMKC